MHLTLEDFLTEVNSPQYDISKVSHKDSLYIDMMKIVKNENNRFLPYEDMEKNIKEGGEPLILHYGKTPIAIGYIATLKNLDFRDDIPNNLTWRRLKAIYVNPQYRGQNMIAKLYDWLKEQYPKDVVWHTAVYNNIASNKAAWYSGMIPFRLVKMEFKGHITYWTQNSTLKVPNVLVYDKIAKKEIQHVSIDKVKQVVLNGGVEKLF